MMRNLIAATAGFLALGLTAPATAQEFRVAYGRPITITTVDLETYVRGVLAGEAATIKSPAALRAMAILARTWALRLRGRHRSDGYDFCALTHCQFFRPPAQGRNGTPADEAARATAGLVLKYQGKLADVYYSAHCGGRTASAASVWPDRAAPYLQSVSDPYCARGPQASWKQDISWARLTDVVKQEMASSFRGPVRDLIVGRVDDSGRVQVLRLVTASAQLIDANAFRYAVNRRLGWNTLKSSLYTIHHGPGGLIFRGRGLGHGVGLCQAGAEQMGQIGISTERILAQYFPGTTVGRINDGERPRVLSSEHFEIHFPPSEESLAPKALEILEAERRRLGARAGGLPARNAVRTYKTTADFIRATGQPGWVSGTNNGREIDLQPLRVLDSRGILRSTLHHEFLHLVIYPLRAPEVPSWYEEGMILYLTGERIGGRPSRIRVSPGNYDSTISKARADAERSYAEARERVADLARRRGEDALWQVLQHPTPEDLQWLRAQR